MQPVVVVGGGPAGLMAAEVLATAGRAVVLVEAMPAPGAKLLVAGKGGFNLCNQAVGEDGPALWPLFGSCAERLRADLAAWPAAAARQWAAELGVATFVGSGRRVFPEDLHSAPLLRAWLQRLTALGVTLRCRTRVVALHAGPRVRLATPEGSEEDLLASAVVLALGGASWPHTGSDGSWTSWLATHGVACVSWQAANCGVVCDWDPDFAARHAGAPLKGVRLSFAGQHSRGECVVTERGLEGQALYPLVPALRQAWAAGQQPVLQLDLVHGQDAAAVARRLAAARPGDSLANRLRKAARLAPAAIALARRGLDRAVAADAACLTAHLAAVPVPALGPGPLADAISSAGGIPAEALDEHGGLRALPGVYACGEMCDWEAPTGGWLMHGCLASARRVAGAVLAAPQDSSSQATRGVSGA